MFKKATINLMIITGVFGISTFYFDWTARADTWQSFESKWYLKSDQTSEWLYGWQKQNNQWYYLSNNSGMQTQWQNIDDGWYYFNQSGVLQTGWQDINGQWYYMNQSGVLQTGWQDINGQWYYMNQSGVLQTGWQDINGQWYYMNQSGVLQTAWQDINGQWYYMNESGVMQTAWQDINGQWYYMNQSGVMQTGWQDINGQWYYMNQSGVMQTGWQDINGQWYYMRQSGVMQTGWQDVKGQWYYMNESGVMQTGWQDVNGQWYYMNESGVMQTGWQDVNGQWYYLNQSGVMQTGWLIENQNWYHFDQSGRMQSGHIILDGQNYFFGVEGSLIDPNMSDLSNKIDTKVNSWVALGDSITRGSLGNGMAKASTVALIERGTGIKAMNLGVNGSAIAMDRPNDLVALSEKNNFSAYDICTISYGVNDLESGSASLQSVENSLNESISTIRSKNPQIKILGILPILAKTNEGINGGPGGYTYNQLCDGLKKVYERNGISVLDWRENPIVTSDNYLTTIGDHYLHPSQQTYYELAIRIEQYISEES